MEKKEQILISCKDISLRIGKKQILNDIDFAIHKGEFISLIGPNGAGKSSLCRLILGLEKPTAGKINRQKAIKISYIPQIFSVNTLLFMRVCDFMRLNKKDYDYRRIDYLLSQVELAEKSEHMLQNLSGGERQRLLIAKALLKKPDLLVMDEALTHVNFSGQQKLIELIYKEREAEKFAILMVSHDMFWVMAKTDNVICINKSLYCSGKPVDVSQNTMISELLGAEFTKNLSYYHHHDHYHEHPHNSPCGQKRQM